MANSLGRDKVQWTPEIWADIDKAVLDEVGRLRVAQKVFPGSTNGNGENVPADKFHFDTMTIEEGQTKPYVEVFVEFALTQGQVDGESTLHTARTLGRLAAKAVALAEDTLFFQGSGAQIPGVRILRGDSVGTGLLGSDHIKTVQVAQNGQPGKYGEQTYTAVARAIGLLNTDLQPGPYALILESSLFADTYDTIPGTLVTPADRISALVPGGFYATGALPPLRGLMVSLGGEPTSLYVGQDAITAYTQTDGDGNSKCRVFERVQIIARDPRAFVRLDFQP